ncbi:MAG: N-acetyl-gamma-glutamyl-phosphate reductase [Nitratireductor sp.]|nr:N-acetyl-gamma-glutamyl-phosphate reductase [Nitratireductor sp.]
MAKPRIFIDGEHGTTGLQIRERLAVRDDLDVLSIPHEERRNADKRAELLNEADIVILCLPDDASREAVAMLEAAGNATTRVIDASTAFRSADDWVFGFAELEPGQREKIAAARFVSNPGCYSTGAIALLRPLVRSGLLPAGYPVTINAVSGYTGGGKAMIAQMENPDAPDAISANHFLYALALKHKHVPEIVKRVGLARAPIFTPNVGRFAQGMLVNIPLHVDLMNDATLAAIHHCYDEHYAGQDVVEVASLKDIAAAARLDAEEMTGTDRLKLYVCGTAGAGQVNLVASLDNLGKGASGAAVQNMDIMLRG